MGRTSLTLRAWLRAQGYAPRTITQYLRVIDRAVRSVDRPLHQCSIRHLEAFMGTIPDSAASQRQARKALVAYFRWRDKKNNPALDLIVPPEPVRLPRPLSADDYRAFLKAGSDLGGIHRTVAHLYGYTGCRFREGRMARKAEFGPDTWRIVGKGAKRRGPKERLVPLHPELQASLRAWWPHAGPDYLFPGVHQPWIGENALRDVFADLCDHAGIDQAVPHRIRHTVGTLALENTNDLRAVQELLGHGSVQSTELYTHVSSQRLAGLVGGLG